jgi:hypothetical protein
MHAHNKTSTPEKFTMDEAKVWTHIHIHTKTTHIMHTYMRTRVVEQVLLTYKTSIPENFTMDEAKVWIPHLKTRVIVKRMEEVFSTCEHGTRVCVCVPCVCKYTCDICLCTNICIYVKIYEVLVLASTVPMCVYVCAYIYIYIYIYIYTHTQYVYVCEYLCKYIEKE